ncbi:MAG: DUF4982 domain-containing protein [Lachnospiraceae bacterium]|nr:DUF4982 domain-containing protein [Lachnospiraceae bacterium]
MNNTLFNDSWLFAEFPLGTDYKDMVDSPMLNPVDVPHDWMIYKVNALYRDSVGFYKKAFHIKAAKNHTYIIRFEGIYMNSEIFLNGSRIFEWKYGYSTFEVDLTGHLKDGENVLCVKCNYEAPNSRWYSGAGIYRNVRFIDKGASYLPTDGTYITAKKNGDGFIVTIDSEAVSKHPAEALLRHRITDASGVEVASGESIVPLSREIIINKTSIHVSNVRLWDISDPYVYKVTTELLIGGKVVDSIENPLGFRTIEFDENKGFFLNGRNVKINGACQHHDLGALGAAMNRTALRRQFEKLKAMGVNAIRTSHNMPAVEVMELADEMGLLIYSESFDMWELPKTPHDYGVYFPEWWQKDVTSWVKRDRNHPSLIIWGIGNEIYDTHAGNGLKWTKLLRDTVRELDPRHNAFISIGSNYIEWENAQKCSDELELSGYNYGERLYDEHHKKYPHWKIFGSETASTVQSRGIYHFPLSVRLLTHEDGQCSCLGNCSTNWGAKNVDFVVSEHRDRDFVFGQFIWTGWDYIGEPTPYSSKNSYFGQIDTAGFEKDTFFQYQAEWTDASSSPMVHLLPYWDFNEGQLIDVIAYSNAPYVELFFNGRSLGRQFIDHEHGKELKAHWQVPYSPGELKAVATDLDGITLATDTVRSFGDPVRLKALPDKETLIANGEDLSFVEIFSEDEAGTLVANARNRVKVSVSGPGRLVGLDNGDSTDYDEYKGDSRRMFSGKLLAIIASTGEPGSIKVRFDSLGLKGTEIELTAVESVSSYVACCSERNYASEENTEVPLRKIELDLLGESNLSPENTASEVAFMIYPVNATYNDIVFKAVTKDGVEANFAKVTPESDRVKILATGDGEFKLTACAFNGKDHPEVISELSFKATGLGMAVRDPYAFVPGCECTKTHMGETKLSFQGGVFLTDSDRAFATYENLDFGDFGADEITIPLFSFNDEVPLEVWEGTPEDGECLLKDVFRAKSIYNTYQENTFRLSKRIKGLKTLTLLFNTTSRFSLKGFVFNKPEKAYALNPATDYSLITGDSFTVSEDAVTGIGNNVALEFEGMDFSEEGISAVEITGRSNNEKTTIHLLFTDDSQTTRQMVEFEYSKDYRTVTIPLEDVRINGKVSFLFLPGSNFDLKSFKFMRCRS